ncbi:hypothetical protein KC717_05090 [Candidatus Dojkabacteria bacterium]|uniref:Uncharacterized protein n=1 Tax=Candidatus Dojkabacteria bacterium TaxID=2099670 RepID=A0A955L9H7_9BACT|nr:hypothetical protein [Candidatus Dojkabacteria bacterium]
MEDEKFKKIFEDFPDHSPDEEFVDNLYEALDERALEIKESGRKKSKLLMPWQLSLAFASLTFIVIFSGVLLTSPATLENLQSYLRQDAQADLSDEVRITLDGISEENGIFIYDLSEEQSPPIAVEINYSNDVAEFILPIGQYRILVIDDDVVFYDELVTLDPEVAELTLKVT